jgi:hypothetical protein
MRLRESMIKILLRESHIKYQNPLRAFSSAKRNSFPTQNLVPSHPSHLHLPKMLSKSTFIALLTSLTTILADQIRYDPVYDNPNTPLNSVACSNGPNGLETKYGYTTLGDLPGFPMIGAFAAVEGWNSPNVSICLPLYGKFTNHVVRNLLRSHLQWHKLLDSRRRSCCRGSGRI